MSEPDSSDAHERAHGPAHDHSHRGAHDHDDDDDGEPTSTGFLPLSLAIALFVTGLFVLGLIPGVSCG